MNKDVAPRSANTFRKLLLSGISVFARLFAGVVLFIFMARAMGPESFGSFMYAMSLSALLAFPAALGFGQQVLRETAANPTCSATVISHITIAKAGLSILVLAAIAVVGTTLAPQWGWPVIALTWMAIADSFTEYFFCVQRARGEFTTEATFMSVSSIAHFALIIGGLQYSTDITWLAGLFATSRSAQMIGAWVIVMRQRQSKFFHFSFKSTLQTVKEGLPYAGDTALATVTTQIDTIILKHTIGAHDTGIYQSGMRLVVGLQNFSVVAGNVFVPQLAALHRDHSAFRKLRVKVHFIFGALAVVLAAGLFAIGTLLIEYGYGKDFADTAQLLPALSALIGLRLLAAGQGVQLTALGDQRYRTMMNCAALGLIVAGMWQASLMLGLLGAVGTLVCSTLFILLVYRNRVAKLLKIQ